MNDKDRYRSLVENTVDWFWEVDAKGTYTYSSPRVKDLLGYEPEEIVGKTPFDLMPPEEAERVGVEFAAIVGEQRSFERLENANHHKDGHLVIMETSGMPFFDDQGNLAGYRGIDRDITERKREQWELAQHRERLEELVYERTAELQRSQDLATRQARDLLELSTPVMQVWQGMLVAPLIGALDSHRTQQFMERLLQAIVETRSEVALVDITGVPAIDTQTAQHLLETTAAVKLLGAQVVLTGVKAPIAQTLVHLAVDMSEIVTRSSLAAGLEYALAHLGLQVGQAGDKED